MASNLLTTAFRDYTKYLYAAYWGSRNTRLTPHVNDPAQVLIQGTITAVVIVILTVMKTYLYSRELIAIGIDLTLH